MTDALFSTLEVGSDALTGYRLTRLEVYNWGTFDGQVWTLQPDGRTSLLTGDIGTGKSTLVDAITTLLLPAHRISYNKAAGADSRERTLRSYVEGHHRSQRDEATGMSRSIGLRDHRSYSVLLGVFTNDGYDETLTFAQVFHQKDRAGQPDRFYVTAEVPLSIEGDFTDFGDDLRALRARLRNAGAHIENSFPEYGRRMRRALGIRSEQAMELFHQTVSMKSVGNLNDFVRQHMLEPADSATRVSGIIAHFDDLSGAYDAVQTATQQLSLLDPLVVAADKYDDAVGRRDQSSNEREALVAFAAEQTLEVLAGQITAREAELESASVEHESLTDARADLGHHRSQLLSERAGAGGDRLASIEVELSRTESLLTARRERKSRYDTHLETAGLTAVDSLAAFHDRTGDVSDLRARLEEEENRFKQTQGPLLHRKAELAGQVRDLRAEITSLTQRRNNLPTALVALRDRLCQELAVDEAELPFAGELLDVRAEHDHWRGAAERVLRPFAMTLLVPHDLYRGVSRWVNANHLGTRIVYLRVPERRIRTRASESDSLRLLDVLEVEPGEFEDYVRGELARRADHRLVEDVAGLESQERAVTRHGLVRDRDRHEKDDRRRVDDPRGWVLGRLSETKLAALREQADALETELLGVEAELQERDAAQVARSGKRAALSALAEYTHWDDLDVHHPTTLLAELREEHQRITAGSSRLAEIERQLEAADAEDARVSAELGRVSEKIGALRADRERLTNRARKEEEHLSGLGSEVRAASEEFYPGLRERITTPPSTVEQCDDLAARLRSELTAAIDTAHREMNGYNTAIVQLMAEVLSRWPELKSEMDADIGSLEEFRSLHEVVKNDDLPRFEAEFRRLLNTEAVRELASFNQWLFRQSEEIKLRVERINEALGAIDYNPGRRITLIAEPTINQEIRAFRSDMRAATGDLVGEGEATLEQRFELVRKIIERFKGRPGHADADKAWTARVVDVRNWFTFGAAEIDRETGVEFEHYTDSDGKSGGQKEKLAYTILAASLAYQFGLEWAASTSRDFRFVVIDEAFGRGSDESTRYALDLFAKLGLQLLIVTPLQKVHVIEPYVESIGYVDNASGSRSRVHTLTIEEYRDRRAGVS
ncbi:MAG TPA: ATP-binding protein [Beutenbergiaceae bacterium]|nr:ATP-binding protein [Beutenbergiaceae bacterium]